MHVVVQHTPEYARRPRYAPTTPGSALVRELVLGRKLLVKRGASASPQPAWQADQMEPSP